ncbi:MAG: PEP-CTERM sorting domain-containing protein [Planctomycetaceae bacterium]|nr:PEP-CTERM sorting domain-containing protein [Planctomycetaceae bacterium]
MLKTRCIINSQKNITVTVVIGVAAVLSFCSPAGAAIIYSGSLTWADGGLEGTGLWVDSNGRPGWFGPALDWTVSENPDGSWDYLYSLSVYRGSISHWIIEASPTFQQSDLKAPFAAEGTFGNIEVGLFNPGGSNPNLPEPIYGIKFDDTEGLTLTVGFTSFRRPVWGDAYAKDGKAGGVFNTVWNSGLTAADPLGPPANGSLEQHLLVPDTFGTDPIPEPATLSLLAAGALAIMVCRRSRSRFTHVEGGGLSRRF